MLISGLVGTVLFLWMFHRALERPLRAFVLEIALRPLMVACIAGAVAFAVGGACVAAPWGAGRAGALVALVLGTLAGGAAGVAGALWLGIVTRAELADVARRIPGALGMR